MFDELQVPAAARENASNALGQAAWKALGEVVEDDSNGFNAEFDKEQQMAIQIYMGSELGIYDKREAMEKLREIGFDLGEGPNGQRDRRALPDQQEFQQMIMDPANGFGDAFAAEIT